MKKVGGSVRANRRHKKGANGNAVKDGTLDSDLKERSKPPDKTHGTAIEGVNMPPLANSNNNREGAGQGREGKGRDKQI